VKKELGEGGIEVECPWHMHDLFTIWNWAFSWSCHQEWRPHTAGVGETMTKCKERLVPSLEECRETDLFHFSFVEK
jgi:hypothetical protein